MARLAERTGRGYHVVDYIGAPGGRARDRRDGSGGETVQETVAALTARGERVGVVQVRLYRPFPAQALVEALPATVRRIAVLDRTKEPGSIGEPLFLDTVAALTESFADGERAVMPRVVGGRYGLSSKEFTPGMVAGVFAELARERPRRRFTIGIKDDVSGTSLRLRRVAGHRAARDGARDLLRPGLGRDGRREQEHDQDPRGRGPACAGLLRLRLEEVRLADRLAPPLRAEADPGALPRAAGGLRRLPPVRAARAGRRARPAADGATLLLNCPHRAGRGLGRAVAPGAGADPRQARRGVRDRRRPDRARRRPRRPHQHRAADLLLRPLRRPAARARRSSGSKRRSPRPTAAAAPRWSRATRRRSTARSTVCTGSTCPSRRRRPAGCRRSCPRTRPSSFGPSRRRCWPAGATTCRSARCRWTARTRAGRRPTRSATSRSWSRSGTPTSASSAATAASSARTA